MINIYQRQNPALWWGRHKVFTCHCPETSSLQWPRGSPSRCSAFCYHVWRAHMLTSSSYRNQRMSNSLTQLIPVFNGTNFMTWGPAMKNYLLSQGQWRNAIVKPLPCQGGPQWSPEIQSTLVWSSCWGATGSAGRSTQRGEQRRVVRARGNKGEVGVTWD